MNPTLRTNVIEATRLTRAGRLREALAALRGLPARLFPRSPMPREPRTPEAPPPARPAEPWTAPPVPPAERAPGRLRPPADPIEAFRLFKERLGPAGAAPLCGMTMPFERAAPTIAIVEGASFVQHIYSGEAGTLAYKLYVPGGLKGRSPPLLVMLHGCTQSPDDFAAGTRMNELAEQHGFLVAYPAQSASANPQKCWNWFSARDQNRDRGEPSLIAGVTRRIVGEYAIDPERVFIAGLSAGGAAAAIMGSAYPELYAGIGVHSGLAWGAANDVASAFAAMRQGGEPRERNGSRRPVAAIVFHGDADTKVHPVNGDQVIAQAQGDAELDETVTHGRAPGGIAFTRTVRTDSRGEAVLEQWVLHGAGHAWSGGSPEGSHTEPRGPDASGEMIRFFLALGR